MVGIELDEASERDFLSGMTAFEEKMVNAAVKCVTMLAQKIEEEAVKRAPIDTGDLQRSITHSVEPGTFDSKVKGAVFIPANSPASAYAMYMHEGIYNLGAASAAKQASSSVMVGRKYLERALAENEEAVKAAIQAAVKEALA